MPYLSKFESDTLFGNALEIIDTSGLSALSLRALSAKANISPSSISYRFGSRDGFIEDLVISLVEQEAHIWQERRNALLEHTIGPEQSVRFCNAVILNHFSRYRAHANALWEFELVGSRVSFLPELLHQWRQPEIAFWETFLEQIEMPVDLAPTLSGTTTGIGRSLLLSCPGTEQLIWTQDCVSRLFERLQKQPLTMPCSPGMPAGPALASDINPIDRKDLDPSSTADRIVLTASEIILEQGCSGLSHRAIANRANISLSSTTHHFETLQDILMAAFRHIYAEGLKGSGLPKGNENGYSQAFFFDKLVQRLSEANAVTSPAAIALEDIMLQGSKIDTMRDIARALFALMGTHSTQMLARLEDVSPRCDRLDGYLFRYGLIGSKYLDGPELRVLGNQDFLAFWRYYLASS